MNPVEKALWYVESHFAEAVSLDDIARASGVSRFHLARALATLTGQPVMRYVRARRLTEAARRLAKGAPDICAVALDAGYGSHEAFTRAFRDQFGLTPEMVRAQGHLETLKLQEPIQMSQALLDTIPPPQIRERGPFLIAGLAERCSCEATSAIPALWQRFAPYIGHVAGEVAGASYGVCCNFDDEGNFDYIAGVEVKDFSGLPAEFARLRIAAQRYAVFIHDDHISTIGRTVATIWNKGLAEAGLNAADGPNFEKYSESFDSETGMGGAEIWIPLKG